MDFLGLDKKIEDENVPIEHLDYAYVEKCTDAHELHSILRVLKSGREGRYFELEKFVEQRMMDTMSPEDKSKYIALTVDPSRDEVRTAATDVADFVSQVKADDAELASSGSVSNIARPPRSATTATLTASATPKLVSDMPQSAPQRVDWKQGDMASYYEKWGSFNPDEVSKDDAHMDECGALSECLHCAEGFTAKSVYPPHSGAICRRTCSSRSPSSSCLAEIEYCNGPSQYGPRSALTHGRERETERQ